jgi:membrane protease YdiL (CAAX protease family)
MMEPMSMFPGIASQSNPPPQPPGVGGAPPDPGSRRGATIAWVLVALLMSVLVISNQVFGPEAPKPPVREAGQVLPPESGDPFTMTAKLMLALREAWGMKPVEAAETVRSLEGGTLTPAERVRMAVVARELIGLEAGLERLERIEAEGALAEDVDTLKRAYERRDGRVIDAAEQQGLAERHGWFGRLAAAHGLAPTDPARQALFEFFPKLALALGLVVLVLTVAVVGGIAASITMLVRLSAGKVRPAFVPPAPGGSVYLETFPFFVLGYLCLHFGFDLYVTLKGSVGPGVPVVQLGMQWVLVLFPLYAVVFRGVPFAQWRKDVGLHTGAGFWREVWSGVWGYFAGLPLLALAIGITFAVILLKGVFERLLNPHGEPEMPYNPIAELINSGSPGVVVMLFVLATVWAPLVEETVMRGCLFRHLRSRLGLIAAAVVSALFFGFMHGYNVLLLLPVITIGFTFALMREWRGSLIAPITAHFMHNATALTVVLTLLSALKE